MPKATDELSVPVRVNVLDTVRVLEVVPPAALNPVVNRVNVILFTNPVNVAFDPVVPLSNTVVPLVALTSPVRSPVTFPVTFPPTFPVNSAVIVPAEKLPEESRCTNVDTVLAEANVIPLSVVALIPEPFISTVSSLVNTSDAV